MSHFEAEHRRRIDEASALVWELLPSPAEELSQVRAEYRDGWLCGDSALIERTDQEVVQLEHVHARLGTLWMLMVAAQDSRDAALSKATAEEMRATVHQEFRRREKL